MHSVEYNMLGVNLSIGTFLAALAFFVFLTAFFENTKISICLKVKSLFDVCQKGIIKFLRV